jgi:hypothetical protein
MSRCPAAIRTLSVLDGADRPLTVPEIVEAGDEDLWDLREPLVANDLTWCLHRLLVDRVQLAHRAHRPYGCWITERGRAALDGWLQ